jgi:hypothetical protein
MSRGICCIALFAVVIGAQGCGPDGPDIASVEGVVTLDGKPLEGAQVLFVPEKGRPAVGKSDASGRYRMEYTESRTGAIPGKSRVEITTWAPGYMNEAGERVPGVKEVVPARYNRDTTLEFDVQPGTANVANFELESKGKIAVIKDE